MRLGEEGNEEIGAQRDGGGDGGLGLLAAGHQVDDNPTCLAVDYSVLAIDYDLARRRHHEGGLHGRGHLPEHGRGHRQAVVGQVGEQLRGHGIYGRVLRGLGAI